MYFSIFSTLRSQIFRIYASKVYTRLDLFFEKFELTSAQVDMLMLISEQCLFFKFMA